MKLNGVLLAICMLMQPGAAMAHPGADARIARLDRLIENNPRQQQLFILRGGIYSHEGDWQLAEQDFERAQSLGDRADSEFDWGLLHYRRGEYVHARQAFSRYLHKYPHHEQALLYRARASQEMGDAQSALVDFLAYIASAEAPHPGDILAAAELLAEKPANGIDKALDLLDMGMSRLGVQPQLQRYAIALELERGATSLAVKRCQELETGLGSSPQWKFEMAQLLLLDNRDSEAALLLDKAEVQLGELRPTPARRALTRSIEALKLS